MYVPGQLWRKVLMAEKHGLPGLAARCQHASFLRGNRTSPAGLSQGPLGLLWAVGTWEGCKTSHLKLGELKAF